MGETLFLVNSITYAVKGRDLLRKNGFNVRIERNTNPAPGEGCGYRIRVNGDAEMAERLLRENKIKIRRITGGGNT